MALILFSFTHGVGREGNTMRGFVSAGLLAASVALSLTTAASGGEAVMRSGDTYYKAVCPRQVGMAMHCDAKIVTDASGSALGSRAGERVSGYGPADLHSAYNI